MLKKMKPGRNYILINVDEPYAEAAFNVLKAGQMAKGEWPEGDIGFLEWKDRTFHFEIKEHPLVGVTDVICKACGESLPKGTDLTHHRLRQCVKPLTREAQEARVWLREKIFDVVTDLVCNFLFYGRKEDEVLPCGAIEGAIREGVILVDEIVEKFWSELVTRL